MNTIIMNQDIYTPAFIKADASNKTDGINASNHKCQIPVQKVYPVISDKEGQFGMKTCEQTIEDTLSLCREKEEVPFNKLILWLTWNFIDSYGDPDLGNVNNCP